MILLDLLVLSVITSTVVGTEVKRRPHIILILADDLGKVQSTSELVIVTHITFLSTGYNDVSWHNDEILTPNMDNLAREGMILENAYMQPMCTPSRAALMTGYYPIHTGDQVQFYISHTTYGKEEIFE